MAAAEPLSWPRDQARFIGDVPGRFVLLDREGEPAGAQSFPFSARSVSTTRAVITADIAVRRGERMVLRFDDVGVRRGVVERSFKEGFIVSFTDAEAPGEGVEARIAWLNKKTRGGAEDRRAHKRVIPKTAEAMLILGADKTRDCRVKDMSASGAAILCAEQPDIGTLLAVGAVPGRVVRHFDGGFGVQFMELQDLAELEALLTLRNRQEKSLAARRLGFEG